MHDRYKQKEIEEIWSDGNKLKLWDRLELAVILAKENLEQVPKGTYKPIKILLEKIRSIWLGGKPKTRASAMISWLMFMNA